MKKKSYLLENLRLLKYSPSLSLSLFLLSLSLNHETIETFSSVYREKRDSGDRQSILETVLR